VAKVNLIRPVSVGLLSINFRIFSTFGVKTAVFGYCYRKIVKYFKI